MSDEDTHSPGPPNKDDTSKVAVEDDATKSAESLNKRTPRSRNSLTKQTTKSIESLSGVSPSLKSSKHAKASCTKRVKFSEANLVDADDGHSRKSVTSSCKSVTFDHEVVMIDYEDLIDKSQLGEIEATGAVDNPRRVGLKRVISLINAHL